MHFTAYSFIKGQNKDVEKLTISVRIAECNVFVLLLHFHLHCCEFALESKLISLFGSVLKVVIVEFRGNKEVELNNTNCQEYSAQK